MCNLYFYMSVSCWFPESLSVFLGILLKFQTTLQEFSLCLQSGGGLKLCICQIILVSYCERWNFPNGKHYQVFCMYSSSLVRFFKKIWSIYASYLHETKRQKDFEFLSPFLTSFAVTYTWHVNIVGTVCFCSVVFVADMIQKKKKKKIKVFCHLISCLGEFLFAIPFVLRDIRVVSSFAEIAWCGFTYPAVIHFPCLCLSSA